MSFDKKAYDAKRFQENKAVIYAQRKARRLDPVEGEKMRASWRRWASKNRDRIKAYRCGVELDDA